jgi:hypothetical protein
MSRHPVIAYFVLACVLTWWMFPLLRFSPLLGIFGPFGPALGAIIMAAVLWRQVWCQGPTSRDVHPRLTSGVMGPRKPLKSDHVAVNQAMIIYGRSRPA